MFTAGCIRSQLSKRQAIFRRQDVTLHFSDFRDKCECISLRWHPLIRHYIVDKRVVLVQTLWHQQQHSKAVTADQAEGRNCINWSPGFHQLNMAFIKHFLCRELHLTFMDFLFWTFREGKKIPSRDLNAESYFHACDLAAAHVSHQTTGWIMSRSWSLAQCVDVCFLFSRSERL